MKLPELTDADFEAIAEQMARDKRERDQKQQLQDFRLKQRLKEMSTAEQISLVMRLIEKHGDDWARKCMSQGYEPYLNNSFSALWGYIFRHAPEANIDHLEIPFGTDARIWNGMYFVEMYGQGVAQMVYDSAFNRLY